ncbi:MAG TPA: hypothetical protein V6D48_20395 [Oculatellaceae cyanobacterium]
MKTRIIRQRSRVISGDGINRPERTIGYLVIERRFKVWKDGHMRLDPTYPEKLLTVNDQPINCLWNRTTLEEFFPGYSGLEDAGEV